MEIKDHCMPLISLFDSLDDVKIWKTLIPPEGDAGCLIFPEIVNVSFIRTT